jgi:AcrR family transcriptional regulator
MSTALLAPAPETSGKRQLMLDVARQLFMTHGYGAVTMDAVARGAGVSKATLYAHFVSKDRLFATIVAAGCARKWEEFGELSAEGDIRQILTTVGSSVLRFVLHPDSLALYRMTIAEAVRFPELGRAFYENGPLASRDRLAAWLAALQACGRLAMPEPIIAAEQFIGLLRGNLHLHASLGISPAPTEEVISQAAANAADTFLLAFAPR